MSTGDLTVWSASTGDQSTFGVELIIAGALPLARKMARPVAYVCWFSFLGFYLYGRPTSELSWLIPLKWRLLKTDSKLTLLAQGGTRRSWVSL
jgi:hypothetical protein